MELIVISDAACFEGEANLINRLFGEGMSLFHLRKPELDRNAYAELIARIEARYHNRIALHQFHDLVTTFQLINRLHYPEWLRKTISKDIFAPNKEMIRSTSIHDLNDLDELQGFDYTFYGPVFDSLSKAGYAGLAQADLILHAKKKDVKIIALGGVEAGKITQVKHLGFDGMAVLGAIWNTKELAIENFKTLNNSYKEHFI